MTQAFPPLERVRVRAAGASHEGPRHSRNEDAFATASDDLGALAIVADGTSSSGRKAADLVVETSLEIFRGRSTSILDDLAEVWWASEHGDGKGGTTRARPYSTLPIADRVALRDRVSTVLSKRVPEAMGDVAVLEEEARSLLVIPARALDRANGTIYRRAEQNRGWRGQSVTAICAVFAAGVASIAHVGGCRAHLVRGRSIEAITKEHTIRHEYEKSSPDVSAEQLDTLPPNMHHMVVRALGLSDTAKIDQHTIPLAARDVFLLATDGLWRAFSPAELLEAVRKHGVDAATDLVARGRGGRPSFEGDNLTAVVVEIL